jgi:hypothetical protein
MYSRVVRRPLTARPEKLSFQAAKESTKKIESALQMAIAHVQH